MHGELNSTPFEVGGGKSLKGYPTFQTPAPSSHFPPPPSQPQITRDSFLKGVRYIQSTDTSIFVWRLYRIPPYVMGETDIPKAADEERDEKWTGMNDSTG